MINKTKEITPDYVLARRTIVSAINASLKSSRHYRRAIEEAMSDYQKFDPKGAKAIDKVLHKMLLNHCDLLHEAVAIQLG